MSEGRHEGTLLVLELRNFVLKPWQLKAIQVVWSSPDGANSRAVHQKVNQVMDGEI